MAIRLPAVHSELNNSPPVGVAAPCAAIRNDPVRWTASGRAIARVASVQHSMAGVVVPTLSGLPALALVAQSRE
jgi:hypothetical protein